MSISNRHHYIPQFLIKNFADSDGFLWVYDKKKQIIIRNKRAPKSIFYEFGRNTNEINGIETDGMEKLYSALDDKIAIDLNNVLTNQSIEPEELTSILLLAYLLKWRVPKSDKLFNGIKMNLNPQELGIRIEAKGGELENENCLKTEIENSEIFMESKRILLSMVPLLKDFDLLEYNKNSFVHTNGTINSIIGDAPIIESSRKNKMGLSNFIFPISSNETFVYCDKPDKRINNLLFYLQKDLAIMHFSELYVACKNKKHLEDIIKIYGNIQDDGKLDSIANFMFNFIE